MLSRNRTRIILFFFFKKKDMLQRITDVYYAFFCMSPYVTLLVDLLSYSFNSVFLKHSFFVLFFVF